MLFSDIVLGLLVLFVIALTLTFFFHLVILHVPYVPTPMSVVREMITRAGIGELDRVVDLGAGDARLLIEAKKQHPHIKAIGCEIVPTVWLLGKLRILFSGQKVAFHLRNALFENLEDADVVFLFLTPELIRKLLPKFERELKRGARIVSFTFHLPGREPEAQVSVQVRGGEKKVFVYKW